MHGCRLVDAQPSATKWIRFYSSSSSSSKNIKPAYAVRLDEHRVNGDRHSTLCGKRYGARIQTGEPRTGRMDVGTGVAAVSGAVPAAGAASAGATALWDTIPT